MDRLDERREMISLLLSTYRGNFIDCCYYIYNWCAEGEYDLKEEADCLRIVCELFGTVKSVETKTISVYITDEKKDELIRRYGNLVNELLNTCIENAYVRGDSVEEFYFNLWFSICGNGLFSKIDEKAFALYYIAIDNKVPYFYLHQGLKMENDEYAKYIEKNQASIKKIRFILSRKFSQKTEEASLLVEELESVKTEEETIVLMATIISSLREENKRLMKLLNQIADE